jgi:3,4-dihydroxy 2-butanone 4-phosphate synthase / GTP cyclohydrolase II
LKGYGLEMVDRVPLLIEANPFNSAYLTTKADKLGHLFMRSSLLTLAVRWENQPESLTEHYERLEKLRFVARECGLMLKEETRPVASALLGQSSLIVTLGTEQSLGDHPDWYATIEHPYHQAVRQLLMYLVNWEHVDSLAFILASGADPLSGLQVQLDRTMLPLEQLTNLTPDRWQLQVIYCLTNARKKWESQDVVISQESA